MYGSRGDDKRTATSRGASSERYDIKQLQQRHHEVLNKHLLGRKNTEIASEMGLSEVAVSGIINSELGRAKLADMRRERDGEAFDVMRELKDLAEDAVEVYKHILREDDAPLGLKKKTADTVLELQGYGAKHTLEVKGSVAHVLRSSEEIRSAITRGLQLAKASGLVIEGEFTDAGERSEQHSPEQVSDALIVEGERVAHG